MSSISRTISRSILRRKKGLSNKELKILKSGPRHELAPSVNIMRPKTINETLTLKKKLIMKLKKIVERVKSWVA